MVNNARLNRASPDARRDHILAVAKSAFLEDGFAAASMSTIAARLGGSKATLYKYFPTKEALFEAVMAQACEEVLAPMDQPLEPQDDLQSELAAFGRRLLDALLAPPALALHRVVQADGAKFPIVAETFYAFGPDRTYARLAARFAELADEGRPLKAEPSEAARQFVSLLRGDLHLRVTAGAAPPPSRTVIRDHVEAAVDVFLRGAV